MDEKRVSHVPRHDGKTSMIHHDGTHLFANLSHPLKATRYHSLLVSKESLPNCLQVTAWTQKDSGEIDEIMGVRHKELAIEGVQFHPESILTDFGHHLLQNFILQNK